VARPNPASARREPVLAFGITLLGEELAALVAY
jgi:hypothetical protein